MSYQDIVGSDTKGDRICDTRFEAIAPVLSRYQRRFTMLDIGASEGYFSIRAATEFDCVAVMIEGGSQLEPILRRLAIPRTILLNERVTVDDLERLAECEHFDVVLALNVLHHFSNWSGALDAIMRLGDRTIIETPMPTDTGACGQTVIPEIFERLSLEWSQRHGERLAMTPSHTSDTLRPMWLFETPKPTTVRAYMDSPAVVPFSDVFVRSDYESKSVRFARKDEQRDWHHGINLRTYQILGGVWPTKENLIGLVRNVEAPPHRHGDIRPWNFIMDGERVDLIDGRDERAIYDDHEGLELTLEMLGDEATL